MKAFFLFLLSTLLSLATFANDATPPTQVTLVAGTTVSFTLNEEIESSQTDIGNTVELRVRGNITVNGMVVIRDGALAEGVVTKLNRDCGDDCVSSISITVTDVLAVDGQRISVQGSQFKRSARCNACSAIINIGTRLKATVLNNNQINA